MKNKLILCDLFSTIRCRKSKQDENQQVVDVYWVQYLVSVTASLVMTIAGLQLAWFGPALLILKDETLSPIHVISSTESAWINSLLQLGAVTSPFLGSFLANNIGRKNGLIFTIIPNSISCLLIIFIQNIYMLYLARFFCGIGVGVTFAVAPIYLAEISSSKIRGFVSTIGPLMSLIGCVGQFVLMPLMTLQSNSLMTLVLIIIQGTGTYFIPESPYFYVMKNIENQVEKSLQILRQTDNVSEELAQLKLNWDSQKTNTNSFYDIFKSKVNQRALMIISVTMICQQMSGATVLLGYVSAIFKESQIPVSTYTGSLLLMCAYAIATLGNSIVVDKLGRVPLFFSSTVATGICAISTGIYFVCETFYGVESVSKYYIFLVIILILYILSSGIGLFTLPYIFAGELFDTKFRALAASLLSIFGATLGFITIQTYEYVQERFGREFMFCYFGIVCFLGSIFSILYIPETKGKTFEVIQLELHNIVENTD